MRTRFISILAPMLLAAMRGVCAQNVDAFNPLPEGPPTSLTVQADGKTIIGGEFLMVGSTTRTRVARLNLDGSVDTTFTDPDVNSEVKTVAVQPDGKLLIGGSFDQVGGQPRHYLARLNSDGTLDTGFSDPNLDSNVWAIAVQPDGKVLAAGDFTHIGVTAQNYFARFTAGGAFDSSFADPQLCCIPARAVALQADGHILIGGYFSQAGGQSHFYFARFSASGVLDPSFPNVGRDVQAHSIAVAPDGSIFVGDTGLDEILKLTPAGTAAPGYTSAQTDATIDTFAVQPNGKVVIGGIFQQVGGQPRHALARLNADGSLDTSFADLHFSFDATHPNGYIYGIATQADGRIVAIGNFTLANSQSRTYMARVVTGDYVTSVLVVQGNGASLTASWYRSGDGPELAQAPLLQHSSDGINFTTVGTMTRVANGWRATANYNVHGALFYLRALGTTSNGTGDGAPGQVASEVYSNDTIFRWGFE